VAALAGAAALGIGAALAPFVGLDRPLVLAALLATSSGAVALPVLQAIPRNDSPILVATAWIAIADVVTVLAIPLVLPAGSTLRALAGGALVIALAACVFVAARTVRGTNLVERVRQASVERGWAVDLRIALLVLFTLAWIATRYGTSILLAGFAAGVAVTLLDEPRRVAQQLIGIGEGFFVPLFFTTLGARLDLSAFVHEPRTVVLGAALLVGSTIIHVVVAAVWRLPVATGLLATAQLGVPAAVTSVGLAVHVLGVGQASAIMAAAIGSLIVCAIGGVILGNPRPLTVAAPPATPRR
jgi:Kef-type K+ transport system membrane component KefB